jgi:hypothetical protein
VSSGLNDAGPVVAAAFAAGGAAAWLLVFVEESRCDRDGLLWLTVIALLLTLAPTVVALTTNAQWWLGVLLSGVSLLVLVAAFRPGGVYDCFRVAG